MCLNSPEAVIQAVGYLLPRAQREITMIMPSLPELLNTQAMHQALLDFVRDTARRQVRILLNELMPLPPSSHAIVKLARRLPSRIAIRQTVALVEAPVASSDYVMVVDQQHMVLIEQLMPCTGRAYINQAAFIQRYQRAFLQQWPRSRHIAAYRQLFL